MSVAETLDDVLGLIADDVKLLRDSVKSQPRALGIDEQRGLTAYARVLSEVADMEAKRKAPPGDVAALMERASKIPELRDLVARQLQANGHRQARGGEDE